MVRKKRIDLTISQKIEILDLIGCPPKCSFTDIARRYLLDSSTVSKLYKNREQIRASAVKAEAGYEFSPANQVIYAGTSEIRRRSRSHLAEELDVPLYSWYQTRLVDSTMKVLTEQEIKTKALQLSQELGVVDFKATNGWLDRWKKRFNVGVRRDLALLNSFGSAEQHCVPLFLFDGNVCSQQMCDAQILEENAGSNDGSIPVSSMQEGQSSDSPSGSMNSLEAAVMAVAAAAAAAHPPMNATGMEDRDNDSGGGPSNLGISNVSGNAFGEMEDRQSGLDSTSGNPLQLPNSIGSPFGTTPSRSSSNGVAPIDQNAENYQLRHNNHMNMIFSQLAEDETFMDVTLTAEGKSIKAHRSVLSAVSPYFSDVLRANPCQHPIVIMPRDVTYSELSNMIMYIYRGEITVSAGDLPSLLKTAQVLQITGLSGSNFTTPQSNKNVPAANRNPLSQANNTNNNFSTSYSSNSIPFSQSALKNIFSNNYNAMSKQSLNKSTTSSPKVQTSAPRLSSAPSKSCISDKTPFNIEQNDSNDQPMLNPTDFMDLDMTCVKEELQSDTEDDRSEQMDASSTPKEVTTPPPVQRPSLSSSPSTTSSSRSLDVAKSGDQTKPKDSSSDLEKELKQQDSLKTLANLANMNSITPSPPPNNIENGSKSPEPQQQKAEFDPSPNICPYCLNYFSSTELSSHLSNKHSVKPAFICTSCNRVYTRKNPYEAHCKQCKSDES